MQPTLFYFLGYPIGAYGFFMATGHMAGISLLLKLADQEKLPLGPLLDTLIPVLILGLAGARLGYAYNHWDEFRDQPWSLLSPQKGGLSFFGAFAPAFFTFLAFARWRKLPFLKTSDIICPVLPFTLGLARLGCFFEGCCYGSLTSSSWSVTFSNPGSKVPPGLLGRPLHPSQLYEIYFLFLLATFLLWAQQHNRNPPGILATFSIFAYCLFRFSADFFRGDLPIGFWGFAWMAPTQAAALLGLIASPIVLTLCLLAAKNK